MELSVCFVVPMLNEEDFIDNCLKSIQHNRKHNDLVVVVDNGSEDNSVNIVNKYNDIILLVRPNFKVGELRNVGASLASTDLIAFVDADCVLCDTWRVSVEDTFRDSSVAMSGSKYSVPDDAGWISKIWFSQRVSEARMVPYINSGNLIVRTEIFNGVGGFNSSLITGEDSELCWRIRSTGGGIVENPDICAIHYGSPSSLRKFYVQQKWHALGMFGTLFVSFFDKPFIMTCLHFICICFSLLSFIYYYPSSILLSLICALLFLLTVPIITAIYRIFCFKNYKNLFELILLYFIYYLARVNVLINIVIKYFLKLIRLNAV